MNYNKEKVTFSHKLAKILIDRSQWNVTLEWESWFQQMELQKGDEKQHQELQQLQ